MADRTVTVALKADVKGFTSALAAAQAGAKALQAELRKPVTIAVDVDASGALAQLQSLQGDIGRLDGRTARVDVDADTSSASSQLGNVESDVSRLDGRRARVDVDADVGGALASIAMVGAALAALPAVTAVAVSVGVLGGALTAAGAAAAGFAAVAGPSLGRINEALKAQETAAKSAGAATGGAGQSAAQAAQQALQLEQAEKRLADAQRDERQAQEDLTRAREAGRRALEDMNFSLDRSILSQKDAALAVKEAFVRMQEVNADSASTDLERERAALSYEMALQRQEEQEVKTARARKDTAEANKAGVKGTKEYQQGLDKLAQAQDKVAQATAALKQIQLAQQAAMSGGGGAASKLKDAFADLSAQEKVLAKDIKKFKDEYLDWQRSLQPDVFPAIHQGLDLMRFGLREAGPLAKTAGASFLTLGKDAEKALRGPFWQEFFYDVNTAMPTAVEGLGRSFGNVVTGIAGVIDAFLPWTGSVVNPIEDATEAFATWGKELEDSEEFHEFILFVRENAPEAWAAAKNLAAALLNIGEAVAPLGLGAFSGIGLLAKIVAGMDPQHIQMIAIAIVAIKAAQAGLGVARFFTEMPGRLDRVRDGFDRAKTSAGKFSDTMSGLRDKMGGVGGLVGGAGLAAGLLLLEGRLNDNAVAAAQFADKLQAIAGSEVDAQIRVLSDELARLKEAVGPTLDLGFAELAPMDWDNNLDKIDELESRLGKLRHQKELDAIASRNAGGAMSAMGDQASGASQKMGDLNRGLDTFASRTDALQATQNLRAAFNDAQAAIEAANGKLQINSQMTDQQKDAVIRAREQFSTYLTAVRSAADAQQALSGRTTEARDAVLAQLPSMMELAGKNKEAREQVILLAQAYGISEADAKKAARGGQDLVEVLAKLKSKDIRVGADTKPAEDAIEAFVKRYNNRSLALAILAKVNARGGLTDSRGVELMAAGGMRPAIKNQATFVSGGGRKPDAIFAEAGKEAYIPYDPKYRERALAILSRVASDFGLQVFGQEASEQVTVLQGAVDAAGVDVASGLSDAVSGLDAALGHAGSLTATIDRVGLLGEEMAAGWMTGSEMISLTTAAMAAELGGSMQSWGEVVSVSVADMSESMTSSIDYLSESVDGLMSALGAAQSGKKPTQRKSGSKGGSSKGGSASQPTMIAGHGPANSSNRSAPQPVPAPVLGNGTRGGAAPGAQTGGVTAGTVVNVDMPNAVIREEADVSKLGGEIGFQVAAYG